MIEALTQSSYYLHLRKLVIYVLKPYWVLFI